MANEKITLKTIYDVVKPMEKRITVIERWMWVLVGAGIAGLVSNFPSIAKVIASGF